MSRGGKKYTHLEMEAALCVWECINDWTLPSMPQRREDWAALRDSVGAVEMRHQSIAIGRWCLKIWNDLTAHNPDFFEGLSYDWQVIPMMVGRCVDSDGQPVIYEDAFPNPLHVAQLVAQEVLFDEFVSQCKDEAGKQWSYEGLVADDDGERMRQSFEIGESPKDFVKWLGEKYDLTPAEDLALGCRM